MGKPLRKTERFSDEQPAISKYWPILLFAPISFATIVSASFAGFPNFARWVSFACFGVASIWVALFPRITKLNWSANDVQDRTNLKAALVASTAIAVLPIPNIIFNILGQSSDVPKFLRTVLSIAFLLLLAFLGLIVAAPPGTLRALELSELIQISSAIALAAISLASTRIGNSVSLIFITGPLLASSISVAFGIAISRALLIGKRFTQTRLTGNRIIYPILWGVISLFLAFRNDSSTSLPGAYFHWSYFTGVIEALRSGGTLLWDTPSQYGIGPTIIPAMFSNMSASASFHVFQSTILLSTSLVVIYTFYSISTSKNVFNILTFCWITIFFFADPELIGPQPYPSSSAVRFGPSLILICVVLLQLVGRVQLAKKSWHDAFLPIVFSISFWWSAESFLYTSGILAATALGELTFSQGRERIRNLKKLFLQALVGLLLGLVAIGTVVVMRTKHLPDLQMFLMYSKGYASGFGSYPLSYSSPIWIIALTLSLIATSWVAFGSGKGSNVRTKSSIILLGGLGSWSSYYVGRAVPDNVIALLPLITFSLVTLLLLSGPIYDFSAEASESRKKDLTGLNWRYLLIAISMVVIAPTTVITATKLLQPGILSTFRIGTDIQYDTEQGEISNFLLRARDSGRLTKDLPISYSGNLGILPSLSHIELLGFSDQETWLPKPLGLLEEPISQSEQLKIHQRYVSSVGRSGYIVWDKINSQPGRNQRWKFVIATTHKCSTILETKEYEISKCSLRGPK